MQTLRSRGHGKQSVEGPQKWRSRQTLFVTLVEGGRALCRLLMSFCGDSSSCNLAIPCRLHTQTRPDIPERCVQGYIGKHCSSLHTLEGNPLCVIHVCERVTAAYHGCDNKCCFTHTHTLSRSNPGLFLGRAIVNRTRVDCFALLLLNPKSELLFLAAFPWRFWERKRRITCGHAALVCCILQITHCGMPSESSQSSNAHEKHRSSPLSSCALPRAQPPRHQWSGSWAKGSLLNSRCSFNCSARHRFQMVRNAALSSAWS